MPNDLLTPTQLRSLSSLPSVDAVLSSDALTPFRERFRGDFLTRMVQEAVGDVRARLLRSGPEAIAAIPSAGEFAALVAVRLESRQLPLRRVLNLTGTITHTNLGRSLLPEPAIDAVRDAARFPSTLEYDLDAGERGHRDRLVEAALCRLTGAEAATVANNNAAAVLIALTVLAQGREIVVSRGELVEIGGSFRIPDVMRAAGARLREVGTTNRTHPRDYRDAVTEETGLLLKVHPSNYAIEGFTCSVELSELVAIGKELGAPVMEDLGSGALIDLRAWGLPAEPLVADRVAAGADLVSFSGDKLLGGPQAGILVGRQRIVSAIRTHPLMRALRACKLTYAALGATLDLYEREADLPSHLPMLRMMTRPLDEVRSCAESRVELWRRALPTDYRVQSEPCHSEVGSGAQPGTHLPSHAVTFSHPSLSPMQIAGLLRAQNPPVIARISDGRVWLDLRTALPDDLPLLDDAVTSALSGLTR